MKISMCVSGILVALAAAACAGDGFPKPYDPGCTERENVFAFTSKPTVKLVQKDRYEIAFAVKGMCDVTVGIVDGEGKVVRHVASGVLGKNAPPPFQKDSLSQKVYWNGKEDLGTYVKEPEKLKVRVMLGLKPEFDKCLGGVSPGNLPGRYVFGLAVDPGGVLVVTKGGRGRIHIRRFDHDAKYVCSILPPPANMPEEKLGGMGYIEYEKGRRAVHSPDVLQTVSDHGNYLQSGCTEIRPAVVGDRIYFASSAFRCPSRLFYIHTDGSTSLKGIRGRGTEEKPFCRWKPHYTPRFAPSPDGKWLYMINNIPGKGPKAQPWHMVLRCSTDGKDSAEPFIGTPGKPGRDDTSLNWASSVDCDGAGRIYVADRNNNRMQIFSPEGKCLKTVKVDRPEFVFVDRKRGGIYILHRGKVSGKSVNRLTKFASFDDPKEVFHQDGFFGAMVVDSWAPKPRLWITGTRATKGTHEDYVSGEMNLTVWEEEGKRFRKILDFDERARKEDGEYYAGRFTCGALGSKSACDPAREHAYFGNFRPGAGTAFDLVSGKPLGTWTIRASTDDIHIDKQGYMHNHFNPMYYMPGVGRVDLSRPGERKGDYNRDKFDRQPIMYPEVPYDYGIEKMGKHDTPWKGILQTKCQSGASGFQMGIGVNMRGDVAIESKILYVPKMEDYGMNAAMTGMNARRAAGDYIDGNKYATWSRNLEALKKRGEDIFYIKRKPGIPLAGGTVWTYDRTGELRAGPAVIAGKQINGCHIDEDGKLYFSHNRLRGVGPGNTASFLYGQAGVFGSPGAKRFPFTRTYMKARGKGVRVLLENAPIRMDDMPGRDPDFVNRPYPHVKGTRAWAEGAEWLYAGASPMICTGCECPQLRAHLDWYRRSYVPEAYRHSIGVLDTNGNLVMHVGAYGNFDSGNGPKSAIPVPGDIAVSNVRFISGTDNYMVFEDNAERYVALKLNYHTEETAGIRIE